MIQVRLLSNKSQYKTLNDGNLLCENKLLLFAFPTLFKRHLLSDCFWGKITSFTWS